MILNIWQEPCASQRKDHIKTMTITNRPSGRRMFCAVAATMLLSPLAADAAPASFKGIVFLCSQKMFEDDQGAHYGPEWSALANCWKEQFGCGDPPFFYTIPGTTLAPKITRPRGIKGASTAFEVDHWLAGDQIPGLIDSIVNKAYQ